MLVVGHTYVVGLNQGKLAAIARSGKVEVGLLAPERWPATEWGTTQRLETPFSEIRTFPCKVRFAGRVGAHFYPARTLRETLTRFRPHLVHIEQEAFSVSAFQVARAARKGGIPVSLFCWENVDKPMFRLRRLMRQRVLDWTCLVVAGSKGAASLVRRWGYDGPVKVIPQLGVDTRRFAVVGPRPKEEGFAIGYLGRLVREKGVDLLLQAAHLLARKGLTFKLTICGVGDQEGRLRDLAAGLGLDHDLDWLGAVPHIRVPEILAKLSVLVLPSRSTPTWQEQFGHVLVEAMSMGVPALGSSCGAIPEVVGRPDLVFPEGDFHRLAELLQRVMTDGDWRSEIRRHGLERVRAEYTDEAIGDKLRLAWQDVLDVE